MIKWCTIKLFSSGPHGSECRFKPPPPECVFTRLDLSAEESWAPLELVWDCGSKGLQAGVAAPPRRSSTSARHPPTWLPQLMKTVFPAFLFPRRSLQLSRAFSLSALTSSTLMIQSSDRASGWRNYSSFLLWCWPWCLLPHCLVSGRRKNTRVKWALQFNALYQTPYYSSCCRVKRAPAESEWSCVTLLLVSLVCKVTTQLLNLCNYLVQHVIPREADVVGCCRILLSTYWPSHPSVS